MLYVQVITLHSTAKNICLSTISYIHIQIKLLFDVSNVFQLHLQQRKKIVIIHTEIFKIQTRVLNYLIETNLIFGTTIDGAERTLDFIKKKTPLILNRNMVTMKKHFFCLSNFND